MNKRTAKALEGSIVKWEKIAAGKIMDEGSDNCPLCKLYNYEGLAWHKTCLGCPVYEKTQLIGCNGTPYEEWTDIDTGYAETKEQKKVARAMLKFLKSLRPKEKKV